MEGNQSTQKELCYQLRFEMPDALALGAWQRSRTQTIYSSTMWRPQPVDWSCLSLSSIVTVYCPLQCWI